MDNKFPVVVVTGFGPFGIHERNASWEAVKELHHMKLEEECQVILVTKAVEVAYDEVDTVVPMLWRQYQPVLMVHVGVSHLAQHLTLESCANKSGYCGIDVKDCKLKNGINMLGVEENIKTKLDLQEIKSKAEQCSIKLCISDNAGRYLCEHIYYTSLNIDCDRTIFIHVPMIKEEYSATKIAEIIKVIIKLSLKQLNRIKN